MIRVIKLRNRPVIHEQKQIGFLQNVILDKMQKKVLFLIITRGIRGRIMVPADKIVSITQEFILIKGFQKLDWRDEYKNPKFVRDTSGLLVGCITDYAIDENQLRIKAIEIMQGYCPAESKARIWLFSYSVSECFEDELIIPVIQRFESTKLEEENACAFQQ